jgi:Fic family protein
MYIEKRKVKNKFRYFLSHSFREGGKVHKTRKYLGEELNLHVLEERKEKAKNLILEEINKYKIIKNPLKVNLSKEEIRLVRVLQSKIDISINHLSEEKWKQFSELFTYNTNAIEGSELNIQEVKGVLEEDQWPKDKSKQDIAEAYGVNEAIKFIRETEENLSIDLVKKIHKIVFNNSKSFAGKFRKVGEEVVIRNRLGEILHEGAPQTRVVSLLKELVSWYNKNMDKYPALILASVVHNQFENIHPFADGNGRVGRILLNFVLLRHKLPPVSINFKNRSEYYQSLRSYDKEHNLRPTIELILKEYKDLRGLISK